MFGARGVVARFAFWRLLGGTSTVGERFWNFVKLVVGLLMSTKVMACQCFGFRECVLCCVLWVEESTAHVVFLFKQSRRQRSSRATCPTHPASRRTLCASTLLAGDGGLIRLQSRDTM